MKFLNCSSQLCAHTLSCTSALSKCLSLSMTSALPFALAGLSEIEKKICKCLAQLFVSFLSIQSDFRMNLNVLLDYNEL